MTRVDLVVAPDKLPRELGLQGVLPEEFQPVDHAEPGGVGRVSAKPASGMPTPTDAIG